MGAVSLDIVIHVVWGGGWARNIFISSKGCVLMIGSLMCAFSGLHGRKEQGAARIRSHGARLAISN